MEFSAASVSSSRTAVTSPDLGRAAVFGLGALLVGYLGLADGGFEVPVYGQVGIALSWLLAVGLFLDVLPAGRRPASAWVGLGALAAYAAWVGLALLWTESTERSSAELARVLTYSAVFATAVVSLRAGRGRSLLNGVACGAMVIVGVALLSRLRPELIGGGGETEAFIPSVSSRLSFPLNYWNGLGALSALLLPLLLGNAVLARTLAGRALSCGAIPAVTLCLYLTGSRGALLAVCSGLAVLFALAPNRLSLSGPLVLGAVGSFLTVTAATQRDSVLGAVTGGTMDEERAAMLVILVMVCVGVALLHVSLDTVLSLLSRPRWLSPSRGRTSVVATVAVAAGLLVATAGGAAGAAVDRWNDFKDATPIPGTASTAGNDLFGRLQSSSGLGRYDFWVSAIEAAGTRPLQGRGPGTFELWWSRERTEPGAYIRNAHSLYLEALAETGYPGLVLLLSFFAIVLVIGIGRALRAPPQHRWVSALACAGVAAFMVSAAFDWVWQLPAIVVAMLLLAAVVICEGAPRGTARNPIGPRVAGAVVALIVGGYLALNVGTQGLVLESQAAARVPDVVESAKNARAAADLQPSAASPHLQLSLVLETAGADERALAEARLASRREPTNWRPWLSIARLEASLGHPGRAVRAYRRARSLNPTSPIFARTNGNG